MSRLSIVLALAAFAAFFFAVDPAFADDVGGIILGAIQGAIIGFQYGGPIGAIVGAVIGAGLAFAAQELAPKPRKANFQPFDVESTGFLNTVKQPTAVRRLIFGETRVGGPLVHIEVTDDKDFLHMVVVLAAHEVEAINTIYLDDKPIYNDMIDSDGFVVGSKDFSSNNLPSYVSIVRIKKHLGTIDQLADTDLVAESDGIWTSAHRLRGHAYLYIRLKFHWQGFWRNIPNISAVVKGLKTLDSRTSTTLYNVNPALHAAHYLQIPNADGGPGASAGEIGTTFLDAAANVCDEFEDTASETQDATTASTTLDTLSLSGDFCTFQTGDRVKLTTTGTLPTGLALATNYFVIVYQEQLIEAGKDQDNVEQSAHPVMIQLATTYANALAGTAIDITGVGTGTHTVDRNAEPRYSSNGVVSLDRQWFDVLEDILAAMGGYSIYVNGAWRIQAAAFTTPTITFYEGDMRGPLSIATKLSRDKRFNSIKGVFLSPLNNWQPADFPPVRIAAYKAEDNGEEIFADIELAFVSRGATAQRLARIALERSRRQITATVPLNLSGFQVQAGDTVYYSNDRMGWSSKVFECVDWTLGVEDTGEAPALVVDLVLREFDSSIFTHSTSNETVVQPAPRTELPTAGVVPEPGVTVSDDFIVTAAGGYVNRLIIDITAPDDVSVIRYEIQSKATTDSQYEDQPSAPSSSAGNVSRVIITGVVGGVTLDVRVRAIGISGAASPYVDRVHQVVGQMVPPGNVSNFAVTILGANAHLSWDDVDDLDLSHYEIRFAPVITGATFRSAAVLVPQVGRPATSVDVPAAVGSYMIKAVDKGGRYSVTEAVSVSTIAGVIALNVIQTETEDTDFAGTHSGTLRNGDGVLALEGDTLWDSLSGNVDDLVGLFDGLTGVKTSGTYTFENTVDLGAVYTVRLTPVFKVTTLDYANQWDQLTGLVDDLDGLWDSLSPSVEAGVTLEVRTTEDDPSGGPTWIDWRTLNIGDFEGRGFQFRALLTSTVDTASPGVPELAVVIDMPDEIRTGQDLSTSGAGDTTVTFSAAFHTLSTVGVTVQDMATGDYQVITAKSKTGFTFNVRNSGGSRVVRTFDYFAKGHGSLAA